MTIVLTGDDYDFDKDYNAVADLLIKYWHMYLCLWLIYDYLKGWYDFECFPVGINVLWDERSDKYEQLLVWMLHYVYDSQVWDKYYEHSWFDWFDIVFISITFQ